VDEINHEDLFSGLAAMVHTSEDNIILGYVKPWWDDSLRRPEQ